MIESQEGNVVLRAPKTRAQIIAETNAGLARNADELSKLIAAKAEVWASLDKEIYPPDILAIETPFGRWATLARREANVTNYRLAQVVQEFADLARPKEQDARRADDPKTIPKRDVAQILRGARVARPMMAYRIGRALREIHPTASALPPPNPLDALLHAGHQASVVALIGTLVGKDEVLPFRQRDMLVRAAQGYPMEAPIPNDLMRELDDAWKRWLRDPDVANLPATFHAAYVLARSDEPEEKILAAPIIERWRARSYR
jgi:hypothetical protein